MSAPATEGDRPAIDIPLHGDLAFGALMDALAPDPDAAGADAGGTADAGAAAGAGPAGGAAPPAAPGGAPAGQPGAAPGAGGQPAQTGTTSGTPGGIAAAGTGTPTAGQPGGAAPAGDQGAAAGGAAVADTAGVAADLPADWTATAEEYLPKLGELSTKLEENYTRAYQQQAYDTAREDYEKYFEALEKHPRLLVGTEVPAIGHDGMETLRDTADAKEWQEAVRGLLAAEIKENAEVKLEESRDFLDTVHASIDLFKNNKDLIPGTKNFDRRLADSFAGMMKPYEVRVDGKLQGYSIPVQPIIDSLRTQLKAAAPTPPPAAPAAPEAGQRAEPPQAGIQSKAGSSTEKEDFSTLFGTIGLPNLQI